MQLLLDEDSFLPAYLAAYDETVEALEGSGREVQGAAKRAEAAHQDLEDLRKFKQEVSLRMRSASFASLPALRGPYRRRIEHCHHITVGRWKGIFLVDPDGEIVIGLVFSKEPHDFMERVRELIGQHREPTSKTEGDEAEREGSPTSPKEEGET